MKDSFTDGFLFLPNRVFHGFHVFCHIRHTVFSILPTELHNRASNDDTVAFFCHSGSLLRGGDAKADGTRDIAFFFYQIYHRADIGRDLTPDAGDTEGGDAVDEAVCLLCNHADAVMGGRGDEGDEIQPVLLAYGVKFLFFLKWNIRENEPVHAEVGSAFDEALGAVGKYDVGVGHEHHWNLCFLAQSGDHIENFVGGHAAGKGAQVCTLDDRSLGGRVGKRDSQLNQIGACMFHGKNQFFRRLKRRIAAGYKGDKCLSVFKCFFYITHEDLNHTGAHKINNVLGQVLLAKRMGKTRVIAETGAGQHGVATATAAALMGMECEIFMGKEDTERQALNVYRMRLLGAKVHAVTSGTATLKDAVSETMREWTNRIDDTHYVLGSCMGPHPFPTIVRDFQAVISKEIKEQILEKEGRLPDAVLACVGGGSNAIGTFYNFISDPDVKLIGCEAAGRGIDTAETAATIATGRLGIFHGMKSYFCQDEYGQIAPVYSISAGLDYPGVGPEHAHLYDTGRAQYVAITDDEAVDAFEYLSRTEGIIPAIESAHAVAYARKLAPAMRKDQIIVITLSGRGDKDCAAIARYRGEDLHE